MRFLTAGEILTVQDLKREDVPVPEWGEDAAVHVQELSLSDRIVFLNSSGDAGTSRTQKPETSAVLLSLVIVDDNGKQIFDEADVKTLMRKSSKAADRITTVALRLSGFGGVEEAEKNSGAVPSGDSSLGSP